MPSEDVGEGEEGGSMGSTIDIDNDIHLCSNPSSEDRNDGFNGRLLELAIWDEGLSPAAVKTFYQQAGNIPYMLKVVADSGNRICDGALTSRGLRNMMCLFQ